MTPQAGRDLPAGAAAPGSGYDAHSRERLVPEPAKNRQRTPFARDRARVVHSSALRRLGAKTQVVGPGSDDFVRTRLTHSLEVAQVGRELAQSLGCDPDVVDAACLAHDLGHPPFGHNGEAALAAVAEPAGGFEGNAQTLRVLTRLEPKVADPAGGVSRGLNLTRASLDAATKYPWSRGAGPGGPDQRKFGVYPDDIEVFQWLRLGAPAHRRCVEAQVMDLSDDIAYSVHDVEDAVVGGRLDLDNLADPGTVVEVATLARQWFDETLSDDEVAAALDRLRALPVWPVGFDGSRAALATLKSLTSGLIGRFASAVHDATRERFGGGPLVRYAADVVVPRQTRVEIDALKAVAALFVMAGAEQTPEYERERELLVELVDALYESPADSFQPELAADLAAARDDVARLRVVVDQVAQLTDASAAAWHRRLVRGG